MPFQVEALPGFDRPLPIAVREARLLGDPPWTRSLGKLALEISTEGWKFPAPAFDAPNPPSENTPRPKPTPKPDEAASQRPRTRPWPTGETVMIKDRLLYLLQPPLANVFAGKQVHVPSQPFPYQLEGIAFLMPRHAALLADEMGLGKTVQTILALRLMFHSGIISRCLVVCPKSLVLNWGRELGIWAPDLPFETIE